MPDNAQDLPLGAGVPTIATQTKPTADIAVSARGEDGRFRSDKSDDAALDKILGAIDRGSSPDAKNEDKPAPAGTGETSQQGVGDPESPERPRGWEKAVKALELDGWKRDELQALDPKRVIELGKTAKQRHASGKKPATDAAQEESGDGEAASPTSRKGEQPQRRDAEPARVAPEWKQKVKPIADLLGEDVGDALAQIVQQAVSEATSPLEQRLLEQQAARGEQEGLSAREELQESFPELADDEVFEERVIPRMKRLSLAGDYGSMKELMQDACRLELEQKKPAATSRQKDAGRPATTTSRPTPKAMSSQERDDAALDVILKGGGRKEARQASGY